MTFWGRRTKLQSLFNLAATSSAIWIASNVFYWLARIEPGDKGLIVTNLVGPLFVLAALSFLINTSLVAVAVGYERNVNPLKLWREHFPWFSLNYFGGVSE